MPDGRKFHRDPLLGRKGRGRRPLAKGFSTTRKVRAQRMMQRRKRRAIRLKFQGQIPGVMGRRDLKIVG